MCGIVGYIGNRQAAPLLLEGLSRLEYRGYDSAGICVANGELHVEKAKGRLQNLAEKTQNGALLPGTLGIGHTRWATHGQPNDVNSHPHLSENGKVAIVHNGIIENYLELREYLEAKGIRYAQISGEIKDRDDQVAAFQNDPDCRVFVGQIATAGLGITLTAASTMIFYSLDYSMANFDQCRARIHRVGQRNACTYYFLVARNTIDERVLQALRDKSNLAKQLVDDIRAGSNPFQ